MFAFKFNLRRYNSEAGAAGQMVGEHEPIAVGGGDPWATLRAGADSRPLLSST
jgi:hypothetical protein